MDFSKLKSELAGTEMFAGKSWQIASEAHEFSAPEISEILSIGEAAVAFYRALEKLYLASASGKSILRNSEFYAPWVAEILDRGKPERLVAHSRSRALRGSVPAVIRPDLLITDDGFALTELDSVPGGIGLTAFLETLYLGSTKIPELFLRALGGKRVAIAVSDEAATYRPEFEWLASHLPESVSVCQPDELEIHGNGVFLAGTRVDVVYRFFELFDLENFRVSELLMEAVERGNVVVTPPMRPFQEEKMSLALFYHPALEAFWKESLEEKNFALLKKIVPATWIVEPLSSPLPACASLLAPIPIRDWRELGAFPRRDRDLVLKASGFSPLAWGSRSVTIGRDASAQEWKNAVENAILSGEKKSLYVLQKFRATRLISHKIFSTEGKSVPVEWRARICPYYFVVKNGAGTLGGALATFCPPDKKIIHGMSVASLAPCMFG